MLSAKSVLENRQPLRPRRHRRGGGEPGAQPGTIYPFADNRAAWRSASRGFTLLELLIVSVLTSVLMLAVWSLFRTWGRLYDSGEQRVQAAQIIRSLSDQFTDDVRAVAYVSPPPRRQRGGRGSSQSSSGSSQNTKSGGNQALVGGADWLVLEVLQPPNPFVLAGDNQSSEGSGSESSVLYAPELQRVMYSFEPPLSDGLDSLSPGIAEMAESDDTELVAGEDELVEPFSGLLRVVVPVEQFDELTAGNNDNIDAGNSDTGNSRASNIARLSRSSGLRDTVWQLREMLVGASGGGEASTGGASAGAMTELQGLPGESAEGIAGIVGQDQVPEVIWLEFRYYDGSAWASSWDSRSQGRLPVAVEMRFELKKEERETDALSGDGETELVDDGLSKSGSLSEFLPSGSDSLSSGDMAGGLMGESSEETPYFRCVVYLEPMPHAP